MEILQSTLEEITESEGKMPLLARARYGKFYSNAVECSFFLSNCIAGIDRSRMMFGRCLAVTKKHHMLAVLSTVRLHRVQAMMNLRQVLEAGAAAAFAIANPEVHHFTEMDKHGILDASPKLAKKRYRWLDKHYHAKSEWIRNTKDRINESAAHANVISSESVFRVGEAENVASTPFFDVEDDYFVKTDLWQSAAVALELMDLFYGVNRGRDVITFHAEFAPYMERLARTTEALWDEQKASDRYKRAMARLAAAGVAPRTP
jgi:hypothetical protein